jgi:2-pyrone-4,6-dicarboxylate lactonase
MNASTPIHRIGQPTCDCHVHVFDPARFAYAPVRAYTPPAATVEALETMLQGLDMQRVVLVQPSIYGTDNRCLLSALQHLGTTKARGVVVVDLDSVTDSELQQLYACGARGVRLNLHVSGAGIDVVRQQVRAARRLRNLAGWHLQVHASLALHAALLNDYAALGLPVVLDHFAGGPNARPESEQQLSALLAAMRTMPLVVKLSAAYRLWSGCDAKALVQRFCEASPDQMLWGTDWPHTGGSGGQGRNPDAIEPFRDIDNASALGLVLDALPDDSVRRKLLVDNPQRLYGFDAA